MDQLVIGLLLDRATAPTPTRYAQLFRNNEQGSAASVSALSPFGLREPSENKAEPPAVGAKNGYTVARRMKKACVAGEGVTLKLKTADFPTVTRARRLKTATRSAEEMFRAAKPLLDREADGRAFRLIGIGAHDLIGARQATQRDLFRGVAGDDDRIDDALDAVRDRFGDDGIVWGRGFGTRVVRRGPSEVE